MSHSVNEESYWTQRYQAGQTGWDMGGVSPPLRAYFDQIGDKDCKILIPGAGNAHEAEYLHEKGFSNVHLLDIARPPLKRFRERVPGFPDDQVLHGNFFEHRGAYDLIIEQTFFCAFEPTQARRQAYADKVFELLRPGGKLVGLWWRFPLRDGQESPPYGGSKEEYLSYFENRFEVIHFDSCYNSIPPRQGNEFFGLLKKHLPAGRGG